MKFNTAKLDQAVSDFKALFGGHDNLYRYGQFYVTNSTIDEIVARIESALDDMVVLQLDKTQLEATKKVFRAMLLDKPVDAIDPAGILAIIENPGVPHLAPLRQFFVPGAKDRADAREDFDRLWSRTELPTARPWSASLPTLQKAKAAFGIEKDRCWQVLRALATMLCNKRKVTSLPKSVAYVEGLLAGAALKQVKPATATESARETLVHGTPTRLPDIYAKMKAILDSDGYVHCGLLSGARHEHSKFPQPEHHVLVFAYDTVNGVDAFLFWDPDASRSNITSAPWGRGFGMLFATAKRLSTAFDDADFDQIVLDTTDPLHGDHRNDTRRHFYQVYYLQSLPLATRLRLHAVLLAPPQRADFEEMLQNARTLYALAGLELVEASRQEAERDALDGPPAVFVGNGGPPAPGSELLALHDDLRRQAAERGSRFEPTDVLVVVAPELVPASRGLPAHPAGAPGLVLSASLAGPWSLAHQLGHLLGLQDAAAAGPLMAASVDDFVDPEGALTDDELARLDASPLVIG
jgi:hypothetical protein